MRSQFDDSATRRKLANQSAPGRRQNDINGYTPRSQSIRQSHCRALGSPSAQRRKKKGYLLTLVAQTLRTRVVSVPSFRT
jgi:hypothetical protein